MNQKRLKIRVDKVYANSYHQNLLLNLPKVLRMSKQITNVSLRRRKPQTESYILQWEDYNGVFLPNDLNDFYLANDGFLLLWTFNPMPDGSPVQCGICVNCLNELDHITGYDVTAKAGISMKNGRKVLALSTNSKVFELEPLGGTGNEDCVCLVYYNVWLRPTVWLWSKPNGFFFLSRDFSTYFRMCIAHLGIIGWQYTFTTMVLPILTRRIMRKVAPHLLRSPFDYTLLPQEQTQTSQIQTPSVLEIRDESTVLWKSRKQQEDEEVVYNKLDMNVFINSTGKCPSWTTVQGAGNGNKGNQIGRKNSNDTSSYPLNTKKSCPLSVISNGTVKKGRSLGKKTNSLKSTSEYYNRRYTVSPKEVRRSKYAKK